MSNHYVELVFYGGECGIIRKIDWNEWRSRINTRLIRSDQRIIFLYNSEDIKYFWKTFRCQSDSYELPFNIVKLKVSLKKKHG